MSPERGTAAPHYFFSSVTRRSDLWERPFQVAPIGREHWDTGDFVVGRVIGQRNRQYLCETKSGRMADVFRDDWLVGALGQRAATLEGVGDWRAIGDDLVMDALTNAGLFGKATSTSPFLPDLVRLRYGGHVVREGRKLAMTDFVAPVAASAAGFTLPAVLLIGTSMSSGKTGSGRVTIRVLKGLGFEVVAGKLTGAARYRDILSFRDAGAARVFDFVDAGLPSTVCAEGRFREAMDTMLGLMAGAGADVAVIEAGASPLEPYNGEFAIRALAPNVRLTVLCASDPYAVLGVQRAFGDRLRADLVSGPAANTDAAIALVKRLTGLPALNLMDRRSHPQLQDLLLAVLPEAPGK